MLCPICFGRNLGVFCHLQHPIFAEGKLEFCAFRMLGACFCASDRSVPGVVQMGSGLGLFLFLGSAEALTSRK